MDSNASRRRSGKIDWLTSRFKQPLALRWRFALVCGLMMLLQTACSSAAIAQDASPQFRYWTTNWSFTDVDVGRLVSMLDRIGLRLPVELQGDVTLQFTVSVPLNALNQAAAYRFEGSLSSRRLRLDNLQLVDFRADVRYADGVLDLSRLRSGWADAADPAVRPSPGTINGSAHLEWIPRGDLTLDVEVADLELRPLSQLLHRLKVLPESTRLEGPLSGRIRWQAPVDATDRPEQWDLTGRVGSPAFQLNRLPALNIDTGPLTVSDGALSAPEVTAAFTADPEVSAALSLQYNLAGERRFDLEIKANDLPTQTVAAFVRQSAALVEVEADGTGPPPTPIIAGTLDLWLRARGNLDQPTWSMVGRAASPRLTVLGNNLGLIKHEFRTDQTMFRFVPDVDEDRSPEQLGMRIGTVAANYEISETSIKLNELEAELLGGKVRGSASIALGDEPAGTHSVDLQWDAIRAAVPLPLVTPLQSKVTADTSGHIDWQVPAAAWQSPAAHRGTLRAVFADVQVGSLDVGNADIVIEAGENTIRAGGEGELFGGTFRFRTVSDVDGRTTWRDVLQDAWRANVSLRGIQLSSAVHLFRPGNPQRLAGNVSIELAADKRRSANQHAAEAFPEVPSLGQSTEQYRSQPSAEPNGSMRWSANVLAANLSVHNRPVSGRVELNLRGDQHRVIVDRLAGRYAAGQVSATGVWPLTQGPRRLLVRASAINLQSALLPFWEGAPTFIDGPADVTATISGRDRITAAGSIQWHHGRLLQIPIDSGHAGFHAKISPDQSRWEAHLRGVRLSTGQGRWESDLHFSSAGRRRGFNMSSQWKARRVDFTNLFEQPAGPAALAGTRASGNITLGGRAIRSVADLRGRFAASIDDTPARAVPGLPRAQTYLGAVSLGSVRFQEGRIAGTIGGGAVSLQEFWLLDDQLRVFADGSIGLADGRMQVDAVLNTGDFVAQNLLLQQIANAARGSAVLPLGLLVQVNQLLSNRTLLLRVTGPIGNPRVQLKTVETLRAHVANFFVQQAIRGGAAAAAGTEFD